MCSSSSVRSARNTGLDDYAEPEGLEEEEEEGGAPTAKRGTAASGGIGYGSAWALFILPPAPATAKKGSAPKPKDLGAAFRSKKAAGDVRRKDGPEPYAYLPLDVRSLNKR